MHGKPRPSGRGRVLKNIENIILVGLMGAGKTTLGRALAVRLGRQFYDTDLEIESRTGVSVATVFEIEGESGFRRRESLVLENLLQAQHAVIATGGGIVLDPVNRERLRQGTCYVVYLDVSPETIYQRIKKDKKRPLLQVAQPLARLWELRAERDPLYREVADHVVDGSRLSAKEMLQYLIEVMP